MKRYQLLHDRAESYARGYWPTLDHSEIASYAMNVAYEKKALRWPFIRLVMRRRAKRLKERASLFVVGLTVEPVARTSTPLDILASANPWPAGCRELVERAIDLNSSKRKRSYWKKKLEARCKTERNGG